MTDRAREYDDAVPGPPGWSRPPAASSNRVRDKDDCAVGAGENCHWPECADEKGGCLMPIPEPGMHAIPNSAAHDNTPDYSAGTDVGQDEGEWAVSPGATPNRVLRWRCVRCLAEWTMEMPGYPGSMIGGSHHHYRDGKRCNGPITAALDE